MRTRQEIQDEVTSSIASLNEGEVATYEAKLVTTIIMAFLEVLLDIRQGTMR